MNKKNIIETKNICKLFGERKAIDNLNLIVEEGDIYGFLGPNGAGKTTTIRMLLGLILPTTGQAFVNGYDISTHLEKALSKVGAIVENPSSYAYLSGYENLKLRANMFPETPKSRIEEVLEIVNLKERSKDKVKTYSLGMKQRLGIAMALLSNPELIILDEPTNGLDPQGMREVRELVTQLAKQNKVTFFISTHLLNEVEQICSKVGILKDGKLLAQGDVSLLINSKDEIINIETLDVAKALSVLDNLDFIKTVKPLTDKVIVEMEQGNSAKLNQLLISNGVDVSFISKQSNTLEKFFFELTEEVSKQ